MTERSGGVSGSPYEACDGLGMNLATHVGDKDERVQDNRLLLSAVVEKPIAYMDQVHCAKVVTLDALSHLNENLTFADTDSLVLDGRNWGSAPGIAVMVADCLPVALVHPKLPVGAVIHCGRAGTFSSIIENTLLELKKISPVLKDFIAVFGPGICQKCYPVGTDVAEKFATKFPYAIGRASNGQPAIDIGEAAKNIFHRYSIQVDDKWNWCTFEDKRFYSYRRQKVTGRQALVLSF